MEENTEARYRVWIDEIKNDQIILSNGEYRLTFQVLPHQSTGQGLPDLFQAATITDKFEIKINSFDGDKKNTDQSPGKSDDNG